MRRHPTPRAGHGPSPRLALGLAALASAPCHAQPILERFDDFSDPRALLVRAMTPDGATLVGQFRVLGTSDDQAFRWSRDLGLEVLGVLPGLDEAAAMGVSDDGEVIVGTSRRTGGPGHVFRWTTAEGMTEVPGLPGEMGSSAVSVSGDGTTVIGASRYRHGSDDYLSKTFRWTQDAGHQDIGVAPGALDADANAMSRDGSTIVGRGQLPEGGAMAFRWTTTEGMRDLGVVPGGRSPNASAASGDGRFVVGSCDFVDGVTRVPTRWTIDQGVRDLGVPDGYDVAFATGVTDDGRVVIGRFSGGVGGAPAIWTDALGVVELRDYLASTGLDVSSWFPQSTPIISPDGTTIAGSATGDGRGLHLYIISGLDIPTCPADLDGDGALSIFDFLTFQNLFDAGDVRADFDGDGELTIFDFLAFQNAFDAGCP